MPISAEEWRVRTGLNNVRVGKVETCVGKRMYKHMYDCKHNDRVFLTIIMIMVISSMISLLLIQNMWSDLSLLNTLYMTIISVLMALDFLFADTKHTSNAVTLVSSPVLIYARNETVAWHLGIVSIATIVLPLLLLLAGDVETNPGPETEGKCSSSRSTCF